MTRYVVVHFTTENSVSVVPEQWINGDQCSWPRTSLVRPLIKQGVIPKDTWQKFAIKAFRDHQGNVKYYDSLEFAEEMSKKAEETSDLSADEDGNNDCNNMENDSNNEPPNVDDYVMDQRMSKNYSTEDGLNVTLTPLKEVGHSSNQSNDLNDVTLMEDLTPFSERPESTSFIKKPCGCGGNVSNILKRLVDQITFMQEDIKEIKGLLYNQQTNDEDPKINIPDLPTNTIEDFLLLEEFTKIPHQANALIKRLTTVGGLNSGNATRRIWALIVTDHVSNGLSWIGANKKVKLQGLNINRIVIVAVRKIIPNATDMEILSATKVWIRKAAERLKKLQL